MACSDGGTINNRSITFGISELTQANTHTIGPQAGAIGVVFMRNPAGVQVAGAERQKSEQEQEETKATTASALNKNLILIGVLRCGNIRLSGD